MPLIEDLPENFNETMRREAWNEVADARSGLECELLCVMNPSSSHVAYLQPSDTLDVKLAYVMAKVRELWRRLEIANRYGREPKKEN